MSLDKIKLKIEERFKESNINNGYKFRRQFSNAYISKHGMKPKIKQILDYAHTPLNKKNSKERWSPSYRA